MYRNSLLAIIAFALIGILISIGPYRYENFHGEVLRINRFTSAGALFDSQEMKWIDSRDNGRMTKIGPKTGDVFDQLLDSIPDAK